MEAALEKSAWLAGDAYTLADTNMTPFVHRMASFPEYELSRWPRVADWYARVMARPSFGAARLVEQMRTLDQAARVYTRSLHPQGRPGRGERPDARAGGRQDRGRVFVGLLERDRDSYLSVNPRWRPTLPDGFGALPQDFRMVDFLTFAGVAPTQRGQSYGSGARRASACSFAAGARCRAGGRRAAAQAPPSAPASPIRHPRPSPEVM